MSAPQLYALVTCLAGIILLLGWLYVTTGNPRWSTILLKSVLLFVLPALVIVALPDALFRFPLSMWVLVLIEEFLKAIASATERDPMDRFFLVVLFGIWELVWAKPLWGLNHFSALEDWSNLQLAGLTVAGVITVLMHSVTAEIYAFRLARNWPLALLLSWAFHTAFNESIDLFGVSLVSCLLLLLPLVLLFVALWPKRPPEPQSSSSS
jgi:hypothetical protein